jgi:hypothetical protein
MYSSIPLTFADVPAVTAYEADNIELDPYGPNTLDEVIYDAVTARDADTANEEDSAYEADIVYEADTANEEVVALLELTAQDDVPKNPIVLAPNDADIAPLIKKDPV